MSQCQMCLFIHFPLYTLYFKIKITYKKFTYKELFVIIAIVAECDQFIKQQIRINMKRLLFNCGISITLQVKINLGRPDL